ncbi:siderophore-interacting protein [Nisaea sp.]|uniref:siderophore-interacting protein n=1 Tax=Nisaea sp. TaxID=2024842 RepID=UPI0032995CC8
MADLKAEAVIPFENIGSYLEQILASLAAHSLMLRPDGDGYIITSSFGGTAWLHASDTDLRLKVEAENPASFNRFKHALTSLVDFVARGENLTIDWQGDSPGAALPPDLHTLNVRTVRDITPFIRRIAFEGSGLGAFDVPDQLHCRLLFPQKETGTPEWPRLGDNGRLIWPDAGTLASRIYTIRRIDPVADVLEVDFFMHGGTGPGVQWAAGARKGDVAGILGPAAHGPKPAAWYLLAGDETGLPGIARILEDLPASAEGIALIETSNTGEKQDIDGPPGIEIRWLYRGGAAPGSTRLLADAARDIALPVPYDDIFFWLGTEYATFRELRLYWRKELGVPAARMVTYSHWRRGMSEDDIAEAGAQAVTA